MTTRESTQLAWVREQVAAGKRSPRASSLEERFWARVVVPEDAQACWGWIGAGHRWGYGNIRMAHRTHTAHRISWEIHNGPIPDGVAVCHTCDNPPCSNPRHLFLGTQADNVRDMWAKGRAVMPYRPRSTTHGTTTQYRFGCRCDACRHAAVDADRRRKAARA